MGCKATGEATVPRQRENWTVRIEGIDTEMGRVPPRRLGTHESRRAAEAAAREAAAAGLIDRDHVHAELGELVTGMALGRTEETNITLYKSVGVAVQDAAAASPVLAAAISQEAGSAFDM